MQHPEIKSMSRGVIMHISVKEPKKIKGRLMHRSIMNVAQPIRPTFTPFSTGLRLLTFKE
jgi:hypothetical protein